MYYCYKAEWLGDLKSRLLSKHSKDEFLKYQEQQLKWLQGPSAVGRRQKYSITFVTRWFSALWLVEILLSSQSEYYKWAQYNFVM